MTVTKPDYLETRTFPSVREAGYAEEDVDTYLGALTGSYNRLIDAVYEAQVEVEKLEAEKAELVEHNEQLQKLLNEANDKVTSALREVDYVREELEAARREREDQRSKTNELMGLNSQLDREFNELKKNYTLVAEQLNTANSRVAVLEAEINNAEVIAPVYVEPQVQELQVEAVVPAVVAEEPTRERFVLPTPDEAKQYITGVLNDSTLDPSDRASQLLKDSYKLGEEYIETAHEERVNIVKTTLAEAEVIISQAQDKAAHIVETAEAEGTETVAEANREAEHVANSVSILREERDETLDRMRSFFHQSIERIEEIASLPEYDAEEVARLELLNVEKNEAFEEAEERYYETEVDHEESPNRIVDTGNGYAIETTPLPENHIDTGKGFLVETTPDTNDFESTQFAQNTTDEQPVYEQVNVDEPEIIVPSVVEETYSPEVAYDQDSFNPPTEGVTVVDVESVPLEENHVNPENTVETENNQPQEYASFTDVLNVQTPTEQENTTPVEDETKKKKNGFIAALTKKR